MPFEINLKELKARGFDCGYNQKRESVFISMFSRDGKHKHPVCEDVGEFVANVRKHCLMGVGDGEDLYEDVMSKVESRVIMAAIRETQE